MTTAHFVRPDSVNGNILTLPQEETHHLTRVLRSGPGDEIICVDGTGNWYRARISRIDGKEATAVIEEHRTAVGELSIRIVIGIALIKQAARTEIFAEKAVEMGVSEIVPLITERTEKSGMKENRLRKILIAGMKQCGRSTLPRLSETLRLQEYLHDRTADDCAVFCHESARDLTILQHLEKTGRRPVVRIAVGPEGGFTAEEAAAAERAGWNIASLGGRRLRTETAAIAAAASAMLYAESSVE